MNPLQLHRELTAAYRRFVESSQRFKNDDIKAWIDQRITQEQFLWREPLLTLRRRFTYGPSLEDLVDAGNLHPEVLQRFTVVPGDPDAPPVPPYRHQTDAISLLTGPQPRNVIVATGTGSGKSFAFGIPIVSEAKRAKDAGRTGIKAVIIYPMNALANSQYNDFAERLQGSGVTIANYTGDMPSTEQVALRQFEEQTGRTAPYDSEVICRDHVRERGVDILITNYVMLELILTRFEDRQLFPFDQLGSLQFLVLDEVHTYTGRQGADVACLVRRLKEHTGTSGSLRCVGTSATVDSDVGEKSGKATIAEFATDLFGERFDPDAVVTEHYAAPVTADDPDPLPSAVGVSPRLLAGLNEGETDAIHEAAQALTGLEEPGVEDLLRQATVRFLERSCSTEIRSIEDVVDEYRTTHRPDVPWEDVTREIEAALVVGNAAEVDVAGGRGPLLVPKVHSFVSQGRPVTCCLAGHLSDRGETVCGTCGGEAPAYPVVFCNACGAEALSAAQIGDEPQSGFVPAEFNANDIKGQPGYLFPGHWDPLEAPPDARRIKKDGSARKHWEGAVPQNYRLGDDGRLDDDGPHNRSWVPQPLFLCPACGVQYTRRQNEYQKFFQAGLVGRATATDVLLGEVLQQLPSEPERVKPSIIAFVDNRQDTAFQSAHANDFQRRVQFRRALHSVLRDAGAVNDADAASPLRGLGARIFTAMEEAGRLPNYARVPDIKVGPAAGARKKDYQRYLTFGVLADLIGRTRWRNNQTLHDVAALDIVYAGLAELIEDAAVWQDIPGMAAADAAVRHDTVRGILDIVRIAGAVAAAPLDRGDEFRDEVISRVAEEAQFHDPALPPFRPTVFSDALPADAHDRQRTVRRLTFHDDAPRDQGLVRWVRTLHPSLHGRDDAKAFITDIVDVLAAHNLLLASTVKGSRAYQLHEDALRIVARTDPRGRRCPRCNTRWEFTSHRPCPQCAMPTLNTVDTDWSADYVRNEYLTPLGERVMLLAEEHSAQVPGGERKEIETRFKDPGDDLNTLVCTPTMELGIDIGGLSAVYMRNVPPSPANYAQRQGRSGRHGQPAFVATFCGTLGKFGSHDQYFYRFPDRIVAGRVAPPRFLLSNEDLLRSHLNALVLEYLDFRVSGRPREFITFEEGEVTFLPDILTELRFKLRHKGEEIADRAWNALGEELTAIGKDRPWAQEQINQFPTRYREAWQALIDEYRLILDEQRAIVREQEAGDVSRETALRRESILRRMNDMREGRGDFSPYRYLGAQGFLPNYAFPRRASSVFFTDRKEALPRHRAVAIREFAPEASIYYRATRYRVERAQPRARGGEINWTSLKICGCGTYFSGGQVTTAAVCTSCGKDLSSEFAHNSALELPDGVARPQGRISSDEEERRRRGYEIVPAYRLSAEAATGTLSGAGRPLASVTYGHNTHVLLANLGLRSRDGSADGFRYCERCRKWLLSDREEEEHIDIDNEQGSCPAGGDKQDVRRDVRLFVEGQHDVITVDVEPPSDQPRDVFATSLLHALADGFEVAFSCDEQEVGGFVFPDRHDSTVRLLFFEREEGGSGLLHHLVDAGAWQRVTRRALELLHVDPDSGEEDGRACTKACYECLLSFFNQRDHEHLDRAAVIPWLLEASRDTELDLAGAHERWQALHAEAASAAEEQVLYELQRRNSPPPELLHETIRDPEGVPIAEADLVYAGKLVVFIDGDPHNWAHVQRRDESQRRRLKSLGYKVVTVDMDDPETGYQDLLDRLGISSPVPAPDETDETDETAATVQREPLPPVGVQAREAITPFEGWAPFYDLTTDVDLAGPESGWVAVGAQPVDQRCFVVQVLGDSLSPQLPRGALVLLERIDEAPEEGETALIDLGDQHDPDTGVQFALRAWWPEHDEQGRLAGLALKGRPSSGVELLVPDKPAEVQPIARYLSEVEP